MRPKKQSFIGYAVTCLIAIVISTLINMFWLSKKEVKHTLPTPTPSFERQMETFVTQNPSFLLTAMRQSLEEEKKIQEIQQKTALRTHARDLYNFQEYPFIGNPEGDVKLVYFFDYQCGYCKTFSKELQGLVASDPGVMIIFRDLPLFGPLSTKLALMSLAVQEQGKYIAFQNELMKETTPLTLSRAFEIANSLGLDSEKLKEDMKNPSLKKKILRTQTLAQAIDIHQTPSFVLDDEVIAGALPQKMLNELIGLLREQKKAHLTAPQNETGSTSGVPSTPPTSSPDAKVPAAVVNIPSSSDTMKETSLSSEDPSHNPDEHKNSTS